jgi:excisionase family DNA binding protein
MSIKKPTQVGTNLDIMTAKEVADHLRICHKTVTTLAQKGEIPGKQLGSLWRFSRKQIEAMI